MPTTMGGETNANTILPVDTIKPEKEKRAYRVGLSYTCKHCGLPKKGHTCMAPANGVKKNSATDEAKPTQKKKRPAPSPLAGDATSNAKSKTPSIKKLRPDEVTEAPPSDVPTLNDVTDALALSELIDGLREGRPPSLITPDDDGEAVALSVLSTSLNSESWGQPGEAYLFSPDQFPFSPGLLMLGAPTSMMSATRLGSARRGLRFEATLSPATLNALSPLTMELDPAVVKPGAPATWPASTSRVAPVVAVPVIAAPVVSAVKPVTVAAPTAAVAVPAPPISREVAVR